MLQHATEIDLWWGRKMSKEAPESEKFNPSKKTESFDAMPIEECPLFKNLKDEWKEIARNVKMLAEQKLKVVDEAFTLYNSHDIKHALRTVNYFCKILDDVGVLESIVGKEEALVSLCACLLHDVGMGPLGPEEDLQFKKDQELIRKEKPPKITTEIIDNWREDHHNRTAEWILKSELNQLKVIDYKLRRSIAEVARSHRRVSIIHHPYFSEHKQYAFFGAVLRLADQMDIMPERIKDRFEQPRESFKIELEQESPDKRSKSLTEWLKVFAEKDWKIIHQGDARTFVLTSEVWDDKLTHRTLGALEMLVDDIEQAIEETRDVSWNDERILPTKLETEFKITGQICRTDHRLRAEYTRVWKYLVERLYPPLIRSYVAIREAVSNSLDSCKLLGESDRKQAKVVVHDLEDSIRVEDNGIGLSLDIIENYLKVLGSSYYQSSKFQGWLNKMNIDKPSLIGQFGIGAFSYLLVSEAYTLETKMQDGPPYSVQFSPRFGVTFQGSRETRGTAVTIPCPNETRGESWKTPDLLFSLLTNLFPISPIPLYLKVGNSDEVEVGNSYIEEKRNISVTNKSIETIEVREGDGFRVGLFLDIKLNNIKSLEVLDETQYRSLDSYEPKDDTIDTYPIFLFSGLRISATSLGTTPYIAGLLTIADCSKQLQNEDNGSIRGIVWVDFDSKRTQVSLTKNQFENLKDDVFIEAMDLGDRICRETYIRILETTLIPSKLLLISLQVIISVMREQLPKMYSELGRRCPSVTVDRVYQEFFKDYRDCLHAILNQHSCIDYRSGNILRIDDILKLDLSTKIYLVGFRGYQDQLIKTIDSDIEFSSSGFTSRNQTGNVNSSTLLFPGFSVIFLRLVKWLLVEEGFKDVECLTFDLIDSVLTKARFERILDKIEELKQKLGEEAEEFGDGQIESDAWKQNPTSLEILEFLLMLANFEEKQQMYQQDFVEVVSNHVKFILRAYNIPTTIIDDILNEINKTTPLSDNRFIYKIIISTLEFSEKFA